VIRVNRTGPHEFMLTVSTRHTFSLIGHRGTLASAWVAAIRQFINPTF
jgi:hypothetical protein